MPTPVDFRLGDVLTLRKPHPCGGLEWEVVRVGADIGVVCRTCGRRVMMVRSALERRMKSVARPGAVS
ncbi:MAG: DUF951 domain-containing protein [Dehalococcoidia bacterium]|nr:DUF951 domain-containing protein [Dehalococcoidia bacterium]